MLVLISIMYLHQVFVTAASFLSPILSSVTQRKCEPHLIEVEQCRNKFYKYSSLPNLMDQDQINDIQSQMDIFKPILDHKCSKELHFFLCSVFTPICDPSIKILLAPCSMVCEEVQTKCEPIMKLFKIAWPVGLNCSRFPKQSTEQLTCISYPSETTKNPMKELHILNNGDLEISRSNFHHGRCRHLRHSEKYIFINRTGRCALKCSENDLFSEESKIFAEMWMSALAVITFLSTLFTCLTFCHSDKIKYPEQPIIFLTMSYNLYSVSLLLRLFFSRTTVSCDLDPVSGYQILIQEGLENTYCAMTFLLNFFFSTATHLWWVTLTGCWMLYSVFKISVSNLANNAGFLHLFVWLSTSMLTISVLVLRCVEADELLGVCSVGGQSPELLMIFSIIPKSFCLLTGMIFLGIGFVFLKHRKTVTKSGNSKKLHHKSSSSIMSVAFRMGLFSAIYIMAISMLIGCEAYQYLNYNAWKWAPQIFKNAAEPAAAVFLLNIFMSQVVGINSAIWIWSLDAASSWRLFLGNIKRRFSKRKPIQLSFHKDTSFVSSQYCKYSKSGENRP